MYVNMCWVFTVILNKCFKFLSYNFSYSKANIKYLIYTKALWGSQSLGEV